MRLKASGCVASVAALAGVAQAIHGIVEFLKASSNQLMRLIVPALILVSAMEAGASDKGLKAEMVWASVSIFCSTSIAEDLRPIVQRERALALKEMSAEGLKRETEENNRLWQALTAKHRAELAQLGLTARLNYVETSYMEVAAKEAWGLIRTKCPERAKQVDRPDYVFQFLKRRIPELK
jgi:hypothetical protein